MSTDIRQRQSPICIDRIQRRGFTLTPAHKTCRTTTHWCVVDDDRV